MKEGDYEMQTIKRFTVNVPIDFYKDFEEAAKRTGIPQTVLGGMCLQAGFVSVVDQLERIAKANEFTRKAVKPVRHVRDKKKERENA
jgi:hypothetical protein